MSEQKEVWIYWKPNGDPEAIDGESLAVGANPPHVTRYVPADRYAKTRDSGWYYTSTGDLPEPGVMVQFAVRGSTEKWTGCYYPANPMGEALWMFGESEEMEPERVYAWRELADAPEER